MKICKNWLQECLGPLSLPEVEAGLKALGWKVCPEGESVLTVEENPLRPDCGCLLGIAREAAAALGRPLPLLRTDYPESDAGSVFEYLDVDVSSEHCLRCCARMASHIRPGPSPRWFRDLLLCCGEEPVNNLRDISTWVFLETGQRVNILDYRLVPEGGFLIRDSFAGEEIPAADGSFLTLEAGIPVISDENYQAIAPVGTLPPAIEEDCTTVVLEAGCYDSDFFPDPMAVYPALDRACHLLCLLAEGEILDGTLDVLNYVPQPRTLPLKELASLPDPERVLSLLAALGISRQENLLVLPSFRPDLQTGEDLRREAVRLMQR